MRYRYLLAVMLLSGLIPSQCNAFSWGRWFRPHHGNQVHPHAVHSGHDVTAARSKLPIVHYGYGYVYDPYARGTFEIPDPLADPLFQAQHKFDSHFPGRYTPQQRLQYKRNVLRTFQR